ncbi:MULTISPECIES: hypothetical protein [unclassified Arenibacter]|uniref:hypothetical protein n=1 Tax=unclassified Arenibacter TaxID=2615047 RepID=UPI000E34E059|nr:MULTISPECIES: hypothetical protein [unclassified Arenibacter]MCM4164028.1 hypothetical protein [Arenibacter sp. A80]RFT56725.1 hypothetical protein D0S24_10495 [Arenibacter sp. P308M17]
MVRIYFDKQIFSHLFKQEKSQYVDLLNKIKNHKTSLFCYSHAHLLDLKSDKTDIKYSELEFIETLVNDNYLSYHALEKKTSCYLAKPLDAFKDVEEETDHIDFSSILDFDTSKLPIEDIKKLEQAKTLLTEKFLDFGFIDTDSIDSKVLDPLSKILPTDLPPMNIMEWSEHFMGMFKTMQDDKSVYKGLRNVTDKHLNNGKFVVDYDEIDFNEDLKDSYLQKSFLDYVRSNINPNGDKEMSNYDFFTNAYFTLDLLGISKEPSKSVRFNNVLNDGIHSYYGAYCDCVISDDNEFLKKTRVLYKLLGIETKVYHAEEFIKSFNFILDKEEDSYQTFSKLLINDIKTGIIIDDFKSLNFDRHTSTIKPIHSYLGYFNRIDNLVEEGKNYLYFYRRTKNYSNFSFLREYELVVNSGFRVLGIDQDSRGIFDWDTEKEELVNDKWNGRFWDFNDFTIKIENNKGSKELSMLMAFRSESTAYNNI